MSLHQLSHPITEYDPKRFYYLNDLVSYNGNIFKLIVEKLSGVAPTNKKDDKNWINITNGSSITEYDSKRFYYLNDLVSYNGDIFKLTVEKLSGIAPTNKDNDKNWINITSGSSAKISIKESFADENYYLLGVPNKDSNILYCATQNNDGTANQNGIYFNASEGVLYGAAWNDYAEFRKVKGEKKIGYAYCENGDGTISLSTKRLQPDAKISSDTYGFIIGEKENSIPIALCGRTLAYIDKDNFKIGDAVCSGKNGTLSKMSRLEKILYPECIIGYISEIPQYKEWNNIEINNRIWINIR